MKLNPTAQSIIDNIRNNGKVFIVVYDSTPTDGEPTQGIYIQAEPYELTESTAILLTCA